MSSSPARLALLLLLLAPGVCLDAAAQDKGRKAAAPAGADQAIKGGQTYKWVDDQNVTHYGDRVPPEYARRERTVLNDQAVEVGRLEAQKTPEQIADLERRDKLARQQKEHDQFLLNTYTSVRDIEALRDQRVKQLGDQRASMESYVGSLDERLNQLQLRAQLFRPYNANRGAKQMPDKLAEDLIRTVNEVRRQRATLDERRDEEVALRARFQSDIDRFRLLRTSATASR
ncbi:MAG: DUF4124 domain-containing protein [Rubrivivax sp.]